MAQETLTYAYLGEDRNELVYIDDPRVENGKACECYCPGCGQRLRGAWNEGSIQAHHYKHLGKDCLKGQMTALHKMAQQILLENKKIMSPDYMLYIKEPHHELMFDSIELERTEIVADAHRRPDCVGWINGEKYWIEILVTHKVDGKKVEQIQSEGINCVEIDLHDWKESNYTIESLRERLETQWSDRKWICNTKLDLQNEIIHQSILEEKKRKEEERAAREKEWEEQREAYRLIEEEKRLKEIRENTASFIKSCFNDRKQLYLRMPYNEYCSKTNCPLYNSILCLRQKTINLRDWYNKCENTERPGCKCALILYDSSNLAKPHLFIEIYALQEPPAPIDCSAKVLRIKAYRDHYFCEAGKPIDDYENQKLFVSKFNFEKKPASPALINSLDTVCSYIVDTHGRSAVCKFDCSKIEAPPSPNMLFEVRMNGTFEAEPPEAIGAAIAHANGIKVRNCWLCDNCYRGECHCNGYVGAITDMNYADRCSNFNVQQALIDSLNRQAQNIKYYIPSPSTQDNS